jgi:hypothetical protein
MGFRFRKSFQLIPGLRLNVSKGGLSVTAGVPGLSVDVNSRKTSLNVGLPGTGLSYNQTLIRHGQSGRGAYRAAAAEQREQERKAAVANRIADLELAQAELNHLVSFAQVLEGRERGPHALLHDLSPAPTPKPVPFTPRVTERSADDFRSEAAERRPFQPWIAIGLIGCIPSIVIFDGAWVFAGAGIYLVTALVAAIVQQRRADALALHLAQLASFENEAAEQQRRKQHDADHQAFLALHARVEDMKRVLREAIANSDPEPLAAILEAELANEQFPVPVVVDLEFDGLDAVTIDLTLPELSDIPLDQPRVLTSGKVSRKMISQADRAELLDALCCGVAMRLIYEAFRVVPTLQSVELRGTFDEVDALGRSREAVCMLVTVSREQFAAVNLDAAMPTAAVRALGRFNCTKKGEFRALDARRST